MEPFVLILIISAVLAVFIPFFIFKIRNTLVSIDKKMSDILVILSTHTNIQAPSIKIKKQPDLHIENLGYKTGRVFIYIILSLAVITAGIIITYYILEQFGIMAELR